MLTNLLAMNIMQNYVTGTIPATFPRTMMMFTLADNQLTGTLPTEVGQLSSLLDFNVTGNALHGPIPSGTYGT